GLAGMVNEVIDRILLKHLLPPNFYEGHDSLWAVGVYGACYKLSIFMSLAIQSYRFAAEPFFFSQSENKNAPETYAKAMRWFIIICSFMFLVLSLNLDLLELLLINKEYREGILIVPVLLLANLFLGVYFNLSIWYKLSDKTYWGMLISLVGAVITLSLNYWLIPTEGYFGAALATLACYFGMAVMSYLIGQKYYPVNYDLKSAFIHIGLAAMTIYVYIEFPKMDLTHSWLIKIGIILHYVFLVMWFDKIKIPFRRLKNKFS
ncbi:MAG: polysaccharide biosynthesis C-terminal domain-containing protein, partial [Cytophagales bacterium]|nr:polysaccharide biosynthesis C-terminal domain-containing protein [Cytophagales bacterium]